MQMGSIIPPNDVTSEDNVDDSPSYLSIMYPKYSIPALIIDTPLRGPSNTIVPIQYIPVKHRQEVVESNNLPIFRALRAETPSSNSTKKAQVIT